MRVSIGDVLRIVGRPVVAASYRTSLLSLSRLISYGGFDGILLVDDAKQSVGLVTVKTIVDFVARNTVVAETDYVSLSSLEQFERCSVADDVADVVRQMLRAGRSILLVEDGGRPRATVALDRLCEAVHL